MGFSRQQASQSALVCSGGSSSALSACFCLDTWGRSTSSLLGLPSVLVWLAGHSFSTKSLLVKQVALLVAAVKLLRVSFNNMRMIVTVGWAIYPAGYCFGYLLGAVDETFLNVIYNIADFVNKIAFVLACWSAAKADSEKKNPLLP